MPYQGRIWLGDPDLNRGETILRKSPAIPWEVLRSHPNGDHVVLFDKLAVLY